MNFVTLEASRRLRVINKVKDTNSAIVQVLP